MTRRTPHTRPASASRLALHGGRPVISQSRPHARRNQFTFEDSQAINDYLVHDGTLSYFGREGILSEYEDELASFHRAEAAILTNSGTSALFSAFFAAGIHAGDEVIAPVYTFHATVTPLLQLDAIPVLVDCEPDTGNIDPGAVRSAVNERTRAIVATHQWGHPIDADALGDIAEQSGVPLIEDISLAVTSTLKGKMTGTFGQLAAFSLGSTKMFSGGQGGCLLVRNREHLERATLVGHFAARSFETVHSPALRQFADTGYGHNFRMHPLAVVVSRARFSRRDELLAARHRRYELLVAGLKETTYFNPPARRSGTYLGSWQGFCATLDHLPDGVSTADVVVALQAEGMQVTAFGYHRPLHQSRLFQVSRDQLSPLGLQAAKRIKYRLGDFPVAESHVRRLVGFPLFLDEPLELVADYIEAIHKVDAKIETVRGAADDR